jgi:hypothetical protein
MSGEYSGDKGSEWVRERAWELLKYVSETLNKLFNILFSHEEFIVKDISINVSRNQALQKFMPQDEKKPQTPKEVVSVEVSVKLEPQEPLNLDSLTSILESIKETGLRTSISLSELNMEITVANIPLT